MRASAADREQPDDGRCAVLAVVDRPAPTEYVSHRGDLRHGADGELNQRGEHGDRGHDDGAGEQLGGQLRAQVAGNEPARADAGQCERHRRQKQEVHFLGPPSSLRSNFASAGSRVLTKRPMVAMRSELRLSWSRMRDAARSASVMTAL